MVRHNRSSSFAEAMTGPLATHGRWIDVATDPNDPAALAHRAQVLKASWRPEITNRNGFIVDRVRGRKVLDIGCVAHDIERMSSPEWLHAQIAEAASHCLGVDILDKGVAHMKSLGYEAIVHDLSSGPGPVQARGPFEVIVAGELIEHVPDLNMLFACARSLLTEDGELIITTPNPWAPHRVRAGQRGECWENADHIMFAFPSGIAELAERNGLLLAEAATAAAASSRPRSSRALINSMKRTIRGSGWRRVGFTTMGSDRVVSIRGSRIGMRWFRSGKFVGETFVYVIRRPASSGEAKSVGTRAAT